MRLKELEEFKHFNELDLLYKIIEKSEGAKKRTERILRGNKTAGRDVRREMQDIRILAELIRDKIQNRKFKIKTDEGTKLNDFIEREKKRMIKEEERIIRLDEDRKKNMLIKEEKLKKLKENKNIE